MCGLAGILRVHSAGDAPPPLVAIPEAWLDVLDDSITHRGPDGTGRFRDRARRPDGAVVDIALVHRRLSIIDHAGGHQPMVSLGKGRGVVDGKRASGTGSAGRWILYESSNYPALHAWSERLERWVPGAVAPCGSEDDLVAVAFNGCIYNHRELRRELQTLGHVFSSDHSDTEVVVHGWRQWGGGLIGRLDGMFAAAIWQARLGDVTFLRDIAGEKPLYQRRGARAEAIHVFGSTAAGIARLLAVAGEPVIDAASRDLGVSQWIRSGYGDQNLIRVCEVSPGVAMLAVDRVVVGQQHVPQRRRSTAELDVARVEDVIQRSVRSRLDADVPLCVFLSGGIDSSLVAAFARREGALRSFCVRMPDAKLDESPAAASVARHLGTEHATLDISPTPGEDLRNLIGQLGLPFGDSSLLPTLWLARAVRGASTVALGGDGGDELFGGYRRHSAAEWLRRWRGLLRLAPVGVLPRRNPRGVCETAARLVDAAAGEGYTDLTAIFPAREFDALLPAMEGVRPDPGPDGAALEADALRMDFEWYLRGDLMRKSDTASMAVALEVRSPFLSRELIDRCLAEPLWSLMPGGERKGLLKQVARRHLPAEIVDRPKQGFAIPIGEWFRSDFGGLRQMLRDHLLGPEPFGPDWLGIGTMINMGFVKRMLKEHDDAGAATVWPWKGRDHSQRLYMLLVLSIWSKWLGSLGHQDRSCNGR